MVTKVSDVKDIVKKGIANPRQVFPEIKALAKSDDWAEREVSATALVEISKKQPDEVIAEMLSWSKDHDPNVRRTASESLRHVTRKRPATVLPVLENLKTDSSLYVKKSVANVLRNAGNYEPDFVMGVCSRWASLHDANTNWIIKDGLRKLKTTRPAEVLQILESLGP
ncbi:MAG TPA: HEAT repeat domain-containing protein [Pyrinomonadaceae bacterium]|nr:HEAT repeat domain-containing protein [Pyrinomonadaceae bacterium]